MPGGTASSTRDGKVVTAHRVRSRCERRPTHRTRRPTALIVADLRNEVLSEIVRAGAPVATGECVATGLVRDPAMQPIIAQAAADPSASLSDSDTKLLQQTTVPQRPAPAAAPAATSVTTPTRRDQAMKYLASGWGTMIAEVLCSGSSWNSSVSFTPMRWSSSRSSSFAWSSRSGHAG